MGRLSLLENLVPRVAFSSSSPNLCVLGLRWLLLVGCAGQLHDIGSRGWLHTAVRPVAVFLPH